MKALLLVAALVFFLCGNDPSFAQNANTAPTDQAKDKAEPISNTRPTKHLKHHKKNKASSYAPTPESSVPEEGIQKIDPANTQPPSQLKKSGQTD